MFFFNQNSNQIKAQKNQYNDVFINKNESFILPGITKETLLCVILGFAEILTGFWSKLYKADTFLQRTHWVGAVGTRNTQVSLYITTQVNVLSNISTCICFNFHKSDHRWHTGIPGLWTQVLDTRLWTLGTGLWILDSRR